MFKDSHEEPTLDQDFIDEQIGDEKERRGKILTKQEKENFVVWLKYMTFREKQKMPYADWESFSSEYVFMDNKKISFFETRLENAKRYGKNGLIGNPERSSLT